MQGENSSYSLMLSFQSSSTLLYFDYFNSEVSRSPIWNSIQEKCIYSPSKKFPIPPFLWNFLWSTPRGIAKYRGSEYISFTQFFREHRETFVAFQTQELSRTGASKVAPSRLLKLSFSRSYGNDRFSRTHRRSYIARLRWNYKEYTVDGLLHCSVRHTSREETVRNAAKRKIKREPLLFVEFSNFAYNASSSSWEVIRFYSHGISVLFNFSFH